MKKIILALFLCMPIMMYAQEVLTPEQQLAKAQQELEAAQKAVEQARQKAAEAKMAAEAKAKAEARAREEARIHEQIAKAQAETERLKAEAARLKAEAEKENAVSVTKSTQVSVPENTQSGNIYSTDKEYSDNATATRKKVKAFGHEEDEAIDSNSEIYLSENAVPLIDGKVVWKETIKAPGYQADEVYRRVLDIFTQLVQSKDELEGSKIALANEKDYSIVVTVREWLTFNKSFLSLDRSEFYYVLQAKCEDGQSTVEMTRLKYKYDVQGNTNNYNAEKWITDDVAVNKKRTRLYPISGKFRRGTINRKNEIFDALREALK